jgi:hypothetical protein
MENSLMDFNTYGYVHPELKSVQMTDEYAAHYFYQMGWMACRLAYKLEEEKTNETR